MTCEACEHIVDRPNEIHCVRTCEKCGRIMYVHEPGKHGIGFQIRKGDRVVVPAGWLKLAADPLKGSGQFSKSGLQWFAKLIFVERFPKQKDDLSSALADLRKQCDDLLEGSELLREFDLEDEEQALKAIALVRENQETAEWWAMSTIAFLSVLDQAIESGDTTQAVWAMACAERFRAMLVFKQHLEAVVWMGHSAKRVVDALRTWDANRENKDEELWQITFAQNTYVLSQVFAAPVVFIEDKAYVGGMQLDRKEARLVDYLYAMESSREAVLVEIKSPVTKLLGSKYRGVYRPSGELTGAIVQVRDYRAQLVAHLQTLGEKARNEITPLDPRCVVIVGDGAQLTTPGRRRSFELFRSSLKDVEVVTYDELYRKLEVLAQLFNLSRSKKPASESDGYSSSLSEDPPPGE